MTSQVGTLESEHFVVEAGMVGEKEGVGRGRVEVGISRDLIANQSISLQEIYIFEASAFFPAARNTEHHGKTKAECEL
jgi:hypothetical protein